MHPNRTYQTETVSITHYHMFHIKKPPIFVRRRRKLVKLLICRVLVIPFEQSL